MSNRSEGRHSRPSWWVLGTAAALLLIFGSVSRVDAGPSAPASSSLLRGPIAGAPPGRLLSGGPSAPANLRVTAQTATSISLAWDAASGGTAPYQYQVVRNGSSIGAWSAAATLTDSGLTPNTSYGYTVQARDAAAMTSVLSTAFVASTAQVAIGFLTRVFPDLLGRPIDAASLSAFTQQLVGGASRAQVATVIVGSYEYIAGAINGLFLALLHRPVESFELQPWVNLVNGGVSYETVKSLLIGAPEYFQNQGGGTNDGFLDALFADVLHRPVDAGSRTGFDHALGSGATRQTVATAVITSTEGYAAFLRDLYQRLLRRPVDPPTLNTLIPVLQSGVHDEVIIEQLVSSVEYASHSVSAFVEQAYLDLLKRDADSSALSTFFATLNGGAPAAQVAAAIDTSDEYLDDTIGALYQSLLHRAADSPGLQSAHNAVKQGATYEQIKAQLAGADEYFQNRSGGTNDGFLDALFADVLHRPVDAGSRTAFDQALGSGTTRQAVAASVITSPEGSQVLVQGWFQQFLHRAPNATELSTYAGDLQQGERDEAVIAALVGSNEYLGNAPPAPAAAGTLRFDTRPGGAEAGQPFNSQPVVRLADGNGDTVTSYTGSVSVQVKAGTGAAGAILTGTTTVFATAGVATFAGLAIDRTGGSYVLTAAGAGYASVDSAPFGVVGGSAPATITSPAIGSKLPGTTVLFQWGGGTGVTQYDFSAGTSGPGSYNLAHSGTISTSSYTAGGLPNNGGTISVRLYSFIPTVGWLYQDYTYVAHGGVPAVLTSPTPGTKLTSQSNEFYWNAGVQATQYWLDIGTQYPGSKDVYDQDQGTNTGGLFPGIPQQGGRLYVRVWSRIDGAWQYSDAWYTEYGTPAVSGITAPLTGALLAASTTFQWSTGKGVAAYELWVGDTGNLSNNLYKLYQGQSHSATVITIPQHGGEVYVTIWSYINEQWQYTWTTYVEQGTAVPAAMTSPAQGSTLTGSSQQFQWSAGSGVTWYYLRVGTTFRGTEVYNAYQGQNTSATVSSIPTGSHTLYVTLWSYIDGAYQAVDYTYTEAP